MDAKTFLHSFKPHPIRTSAMEKVRSGLAGGIAILLLTLILHNLPHPVFPILILGSMAASATLLYAVPHSPLSQPWNLVGGHLISGLIGWLCALLIPQQEIAAGVAVGSSILISQFLSCLHPPSAATSLLMVLGSAQFQQMGWEWAMLIVAANAGFSLLLALTINNLLPGRHYPTPAAPPPAPPKPAPFIELEPADLKWALEQMDSVIDISEEDLAEIYQLALLRAQIRIEHLQG